MQADAIQNLRTLILAADGNRQVTTDGGPVDAIIAQTGESVVPLEKYRFGRSRFRGAFQTNSIDSLAIYVKASGETDVSGFVDADAMACTVFLNLGTPVEPGHADHTATLTMRKTAIYAALLKIDGAQLSQQALAEWIEDWRGFLAVPGGDLAKAINAVRKIKIEAGRTATSEVGNLKATKTALEQIEASSDEGLPEELACVCEPYEGLTGRSIKLRLSVIHSETPKLVLRIAAKEDLIDRLASEFASNVSQSLNGLAKVVTGTFKP